MLFVRAYGQHQGLRLRELLVMRRDRRRDDHRLAVGGAEAHALGHRGLHAVAATVECQIGALGRLKMYDVFDAQRCRGRIGGQGAGDERSDQAKADHDRSEWLHESLSRSLLFCV